MINLFSPHLTNSILNLYKSCMKLIEQTHLLRNCTFKYKCKQTWDSLEESKGLNYDLVRFCPECKEDVFLAESDEQIIWFVETCRCIAIPIKQTRLNRMLNRHLVGVPRLRS